MDLNNNSHKIYSLYESAVECSDLYERLLTKCKTENSLDTNWERLNELQTNFSNIIKNLIQLEENDLYFTSLIRIRQQFFNHLTILNSTKNEVTINDITITKLPYENHSQECGLKLCSERDYVSEPSTKKAKFSSKHENEKEALQNMIKDTVITPKSKGLCDVAGLQEEKGILKEVVVYPLQYPHLFKGIRRTWTKALLYGPPGTGKTQLIHSIAAEVGAKLFCVSNADILSRWVGESEKLLRTLFQYCIQIKERSIIFFDEVDSFCRRRTTNEADHTRRIKNDLLTQLAELDNSSQCQVFFLAATNCPWDLDPAFIRRFHKRIYIPLPNRITRLEILKLFVKDIQISISPKRLAEILDKTEGFSGSDISDLVNSAAYQPIKELENTMYWTVTAECKFMPSVQSPRALRSPLNGLPPQKVAVRDINSDDISRALSHATKTVTKEDIKKYEDFNKSYGSLRS